MGPPKRRKLHHLNPERLFPRDSQKLPPAAMQNLTSRAQAATAVGNA